jgi:hypothetical protein
VYGNSVGSAIDGHLLCVEWDGSGKVAEFSWSHGGRRRQQQQQQQ